LAAIVAMLTLDDICFGRESTAIVAHASLHFPAGELTAILGPNGAGKTSLLQLAAGLLRADSGQVMFDDGVDFADTRLRARRIAYLPQMPEIIWPMAARDIIALGRLPHQFGLRLSDNDMAAIEEAMATCGVGCFAGRAINTLSGGEQARVMLARLLATQADILLLDEPLKSLDPAAQIHMLDVLAQEARKGSAVVVVMHDINLARHYCGRAVLMKQGRIMADGRADEVLSAAQLGTIFNIDYAQANSDAGSWLHPVAGRKD